MRCCQCGKAARLRLVIMGEDGAPFRIRGGYCRDCGYARKSCTTLAVLDWWFEDIIDR